MTCRVIVPPEQYTVACTSTINISVLSSYFTFFFNHFIYNIKRLLAEIAAVSLKGLQTRVLKFDFEKVVTEI